MESREIAIKICAFVSSNFIGLQQPTKRKSILLQFGEKNRGTALQTLDDLVRNGFIYDEDGSQKYRPRAAAIECAGDQKLSQFLKDGFAAAFKTLKAIYESDQEDRTIEFAEVLRKARELLQSVEENQLRWGLHFCREFGLFRMIQGGTDPLQIHQFAISELVNTSTSAEDFWKNQTERYRFPSTWYNPESIPASQGPATISASTAAVARPSKAETFVTAFHTYTKGQQLGSGGAGIVYKAFDEDGNPVAIKVLASNVGARRSKRFQNEIYFCMKNTHQNVIRVLEYGLAGKDERPFYVMPYYPGTLRDAMKKGIQPANILPLYAQILAGVDAAHRLNVCHRDLKPENILHDPDKPSLVVADFGIAQFREEDLYTAVETSHQERLANFVYSAPEQRVRGRTVDHRADIFALGLILNEMFTGEVRQGSGYRRIAQVAPQFAYLDPIAEAMVQQQPDLRPSSIADIQNQLIARGNEFISLQKLDEPKSRVIPESTPEKPRPISVIGGDYNNGSVILALDQSPSGDWLRIFKSPKASYSYVTGQIEPALFNFNMSQVTVRADERFAQRAVDLFKEYAHLADVAYAESVVSRQRAAEETQRKALKKQVEQEERRQALLKTLKF